MPLDAPSALRVLLMILSQCYCFSGFLHPVVDLTTTLNTTSIIVSWTAPFSLDVTGVDPDVWYTIFIYNVTHDPITISCTDCVNITETHYTFYPDYYNPCHKYNFTVIPFNGAGQGQSNGNITSKCMSKCV